MAALISPGVSVTIIDESQYQPTAAGTIAYVLLATGQDKLNPSGSIAPYTTKANAGKILPISSQREMINNFGIPTFIVDASDNPIHAHELNEYGLLAAYSSLGVSNKVYVQRADVNLTELLGTSIRPTGQPADGLYWLDLTNTAWGVYDWTTTTGFVSQDVTVITEVNDVSNNVPLDSVGSIGDYAVVTLDTKNPIYYKDYLNSWVLVGTDDWQTAVPTLVGTVANPSDLVVGEQVGINGTNVTISGTSVESVRDDINNATIDGVIATVNLVQQLELRINSLSESNGATADGKLKIAKGSTFGANIADCAVKLGLITTAIDGNVTVKTVAGPAIQYSTYRDVPAWRKTDDVPRPAGSVWLKTSATGNGANWNIKKYSLLTDTWSLLPAPLYDNDTAAIQGLDPVGGGGALPVGTIFVSYDLDDTGRATFRPYIKNVLGLLKITGRIPTQSTPFSFTTSDAFDMEVSVPGSLSTQSATITLTGTVTSATFVAAVLAADLPNVTARLETSGAISISHLAGGTIKFTLGTGTPLTEAGLIDDSNVREVRLISNNALLYYIGSPFTEMIYTNAFDAPYSNPLDGVLWYYNSPLEVDIMISDGQAWKGYRNVSNDARGYNLTATDPLGPILAASVAPATQVSGSSLVPGDLWIDTGDLENYPVIRRYTDTNSWELLDNADQVSVDGVLFADARWSYNGTTEPVIDAYPDIVDLGTSDYIDSDCPDYRLYARGTLLFNIRRSGYGVKRFESEWFADKPFSDDSFPDVLSAWVSNSGVDEDQVPYFGHKAPRNVVVEALKAGIESSVHLREEQVEFNLLCCPGYPELIGNMITLNNDRKQTAFIIGDSPLTLNSSTASIETWASNENLAEDNGVNGLVSNSEYLAVYYPSGLATNLDGESVVVPPSHVMLRTMIRSDNVSYPWFAPAGVRRGLIDNVTSIGYVDTTDNNDFKSIGVTNALRDVLYTQRVNPLTVLPGVGLVVYGQKTRSATTSAMDRVNVARLTCYLRVVLERIARPFIFEPNDTITRNQVKSAFEAVLNDLIAKRALYDYLVVCDTSNNTPDRIDRNELWIDIAIEPVKAIEFIYIPVRLKNTGSIAAG